MADEITNKELVAALRPMYGQGPSIGLKLLWQEALRRLEETPDSTSSETLASAVAGADTVVASEQTQTTSATEWPKDQTANAQSAASDNPKENTSASANDTDGKAIIATDDPVKNMPLTASGRANVRMGRTADGKGRP